MEKMETLDVTILEPKIKHPTIFKKFEELIEGQSFVIYNDHDPKPLYYQMLGELGNVFHWEYIESGPDFWKVKLTKNIFSENNNTIGDLVSKDFRRAEVFKKFNIDFCCGGKKTLEQVCQEKNIDKSVVESELKILDEKSEIPSQNINNWTVDFLIDYIINTHHVYVTTAIPILLEYTRKVSKVHGDKNPEMILVADKFLEVAEELTSHMIKEERILFPFIKSLALNSDEKVLSCSFGTVKNPITAMENEHEMVGDIFKIIRKLTNDYSAPEEACTTFRVTLKKLEEFESDLHRHIHLENNILFPKSIELEKNSLF